MFGAIHLDSAHLHPEWHLLDHIHGNCVDAISFSFLFFRNKLKQDQHISVITDLHCQRYLKSNYNYYKWAPSSKFLSSSIPSWLILTAHAQPFRGARDLAFCLTVPLDSLLVWASSEGSGETARMRRLAWTFAARICDKYQIRLTRSKWFIQAQAINCFSPYNILQSMAILCQHHLFFTKGPGIAGLTFLIEFAYVVTVFLSCFPIWKLRENNP